MKKIFGVVAALISLSLMATPPAQAHASLNTVLTLAVGGDDSVQAEARIPLSELNGALGRKTTDPTVPDSLRAYLAGGFGLASAGQPWSGRLSGTAIDGADLMARFSFAPPAGQHPRTATIDYRIVVDRVATHSVIVYVKEASGKTYAVGMIARDDAGDLPAPLAITFAPRSPSFMSAVWLGINHLRGGPDHLLFLLTLLLVAPFYVVSLRWRRTASLRQTLLHMVALSLAFTLGHSLSLLAGSFLNVAPFEPLIEVFIALTIVVSALNALRPLFGRAELFVVPVFGLVHGLAFSSQLFSAHIAISQRLLTTFGFNLGLELCQIAVLAIALPLYLLVLRADRRGLSRMALSGGALACAAYWAITRVAALI